MAYVLALLATGIAGWRIWMRLRYFLHMFQLEGYKPIRFRAWLRPRIRGGVVRVSHAVALVVLALAAAGATRWAWPPLVALALWPVLFGSSRHYRDEQHKKPIAYTYRLQRLLAATVVLLALLAAAGLTVALAQAHPAGWLAYLAALYLGDLGVPYWILLATSLMRPVEASIQEGYKRQARATLRARTDLDVIGITGSYGKTSVKFIVAEILRQRSNVLATPGSYNTPMGVCLVVNNQLRPEHQVLVLEMGMRYRGDIRELCALAPPHLAVVTNVGVAHLESMGSIENIALEKGDLLAYMQKGGPAILNFDDPRVLAMRERATGPVWGVSVAGHPDAAITASDITYGPDGAAFTVRDETGATYRFRSRLLGRHNVLNLLLGVAVGRARGLRLRQIAGAVGRMEPVAHRLQLRQEGALTIIDDAFNSNPVGARNAVEVLGAFTEGRRVIVTPGMVELGDREWEENRLLGEHIARHADLAILVGRERTRPIQEGLAAGNFATDHMQIVGSVFEARTLLRAGDVVLFENDLPDQYDEP